MNTQRNRLMLPFAALLAAAVACFWFWREDPQLAPNAQAAAPVGDAVPAAASVPLTIAGTVERAAAPTPASTPSPDADPTLAHLRGRCVDEDGAPLPGCTAKFDGWEGNQDAFALQGKVDWRDPEPIVTGADGRFDFAFHPPSGLQYLLDIQADGRVPRTGRWGRLQPAQIIDLGDIVVARGFAVRGRVVDESGAPMAKVAVAVQNLPLPIAASMAANNIRYGTSDASGEFTIQVAIPVGTWSIDVQARGRRLLGPDSATVTERGAEPLLVTVRSMPSIRGQVFDELGQPVQGVEIRAELNRSGRMASGRSNAEGRFTIYAVDAEPKPVQLRIDHPGPCEPPENEDATLWEWGSQDVRLQLRRALTCEIVVVERVSGAPVTQFAVSCYSERAKWSSQKGLRHSGEHPEGRLTVDGVWRGKNFLRVTPLDPALLPSATLEFEASDAGVPPQRVEVDRLDPATVRVRAADGTPVPGSKVEVIVKGSDQFSEDSWAQDSRGSNLGWPSNPNHRSHRLVSSATTGVDGVAKVFLPPAAVGLVVRVTGEHSPTIVDPAQFPAGQDLIVVPLVAGSIVGVVRVQGLPADLIQILRHRGEPTQHAYFKDEVALAADGSFALRRLSEGRYQLRLTYVVPYRSTNGGSEVRHSLGLPDLDLVVEAGRETAVEVDATAIVPGTVRGRVFLDGAVAAPARVFLRMEPGGQYGQFLLDADGVFEAAGLLPGKYRVGLVVGDFQTGSEDAILHDDLFSLAPGQQLISDFHYVRRRLVITLLQSDGKTPAANVAYSCSIPGTMPRNGTTDQEGRLILDPAPTGEVHIRPRNTRYALGPVQVPEGQTSHSVTLTLRSDEGK